jgi:quercetin dioxygenase-like cupin family protein
MDRPEPFSLVDYSVTLDANGSGSTIPRGTGRPPQTAGLTVGWEEMSRAPPHGGECHPDGDETIILMSGELSILLEEEMTRTVRLRSGEAFIVPRGLWHRLLIDSPVRLIHLTPGISQARPLSAAPGARA